MNLLYSASPFDSCPPLPVGLRPVPPLVHALAGVSALAFLGLTAIPSHAAVTLPGVLGSNMAVQSGEPLQFWGWADAGEKVEVKIGGVVVASTQGAGKGTPWRVQLPAQKPGPVPDIEVAGPANSLTLNNVLAGEVWLCSGQSNMVMTLQKGLWCGYGGALHADEEVASATDSQIRVYQAGKGWRVCSPQTAPEFSATAYFFARQLREQLKAPVGLLIAASGGTAAEPWAPLRTLEGDPVFDGLKAKATALKEEFGPRLLEDQAALAAWKKQVEHARAAGEQPPAMPEPQLTPEQSFAVSDSAPLLRAGSLYENNIRPLAPFNIKGALWYQGESNARRGEVYASVMGHLIEGWREDWGKPFPFVLVTLAGFGKPEAWTPTQGSYPLVREAQIRVAQQVPGAGVVCAVDVGDATNIHPPNKQAVGRRAALWALKNVYERPLVPAGPVFGEVVFSAEKAEVPVKENGEGLMLKGPEGFELAGADGQFYPAQAVLRGSSIVVTAPGVTRPSALRYAFQNMPACTVYNGAGLPALPFRTDRWSVGPAAE
jgi:sialate O-acetylesterase